MSCFKILLMSQGRSKFNTKEGKISECAGATYKKSVPFELGPSFINLVTSRSRIQVTEMNSKEQIKLQCCF